MSKKYIGKFCTIGDANTKQVAESIFINLSINKITAGTYYVRAYMCALLLQRNSKNTTINLIEPLHTAHCMGNSQWLYSANL